MIFDTHSHYTSHRFKGHLTEVLSSLPSQNVCGVVDCGTDYSSCLESISLSEKYSWFFTAVGIHPDSIINEDASTQTQFDGDWQSELNEIETLLSHEKVVAIGECGLDYHWPIPKQEQILMFHAHLQLAQKHDMPIIIHDREAHSDMYEILKQYKPKGVLHCYSGSADDAKWISDNGLYIGVGGVITFPNSRKLQETVIALPLEKIVLETDCPYMAPVPFRGKECNSAMIIHVAQKIAQLKNTSVEKVLEVTENNAKNVFFQNL